MRSAVARDFSWVLASFGHTPWQRTVSPGATERAVQHVLDARSGYTRLTLWLNHRRHFILYLCPKARDALLSRPAQEESKMQSVFPLDSRKLRDFCKIAPVRNGSRRKAPGYILKFRCVNCGRPTASASYVCEGVVPEDRIRARIYEAKCECGWKGEACGVSAIQVQPIPDIKLKPKE